MMLTVDLIPDDILASMSFMSGEMRQGHSYTAHRHEWTDKPCGYSNFAEARSCDSFLGARAWKEKKFETKIRVDEDERDSPTHKVDCFKNRVSLEIEWNNKDPFFERDLNNFRLLFELRVIEIAICARSISRSSASASKILVSAIRWRRSRLNEATALPMMAIAADQQTFGEVRHWGMPSARPGDGRTASFLLITSNIVVSLNEPSGTAPASP
jgi:hypothetical protein